jgi:arsenate reductase
MDIDFSPLLRRCLDAAIDELATDFRGVFCRETVARSVEDSAERIGERPTVGPNFLPVIIKRFAQERLGAAAQADGQVDKPLPEVLFVCEDGASHLRRLLGRTLRRCARSPPPPAARRSVPGEDRASTPTPTT